MIQNLLYLIYNLKGVEVLYLNSIAKLLIFQEDDKTEIDNFQNREDY